jgi:metal-responsive CopG/Arc/MetJ family transcriptional regulator
MKTITVKLDDELAAEIERFQRDSDYATKSEMVRDALRTLMVAHRRAQLQANLQRYLQDQQALAQVADEVEARMAVTEEALERAEG